MAVHPASDRERGAAPPALGAVEATPSAMATDARPVRDDVADETTLPAAMRIAVGVVVIGGAATAELLRRALGVTTRDGDHDDPLPAEAIVGALLGVSIDAAAASLSLLRRGWSIARWGAWLLPTEGIRLLAGRAVDRANERWDATSADAAEAADAVLRELVPAVAEALLDQLDLTRIVLDRLDLDRIVAAADLDAAARSIDVDAIAARIDLDRIVARLDLDAIAARIDPNAVVDRVDLDRVLGRIDAAAIAREVIDELDLLAVMREAGETVTSEAVDDVRFGAVDADRAVARIVDRLLRRRAARTLAPPTTPRPDDGAR